METEHTHAPTSFGLDMHWTWESATLGDEYLAWHETARRECVRDILQMTHLADSGHPGGSLSSLDLYLVLYSHCRLDPADPWMHDRDRIVVSHGHTSPGVYSVLCRLGYFDRESMLTGFRRTFSKFEGHIERDVPGVEWTTGNLGQGLSAAAGMALALRFKKVGAQVFVPMGDGEQQKGQISEARRFVRKYQLHNVTALVDLNHQQIGGRIESIMPQDIAAGWEADGWTVTTIDGHDPVQIHRACRDAVRDTTTPHCILARTEMGKGVSFMEGTHAYHGVAANAEEYARAAEESGEDPALWDLGRLRVRIEALESGAEAPVELASPPDVYPAIRPGTPRTYEVGTKSDNRSAFGNALLDVAEANRADDFTPIAAFDCDLEGSVKLGAFHKAFPGHFIQSGIQEHHTATCAGALSIEEIVSVFADFGVFGVCETYNQHRLTDINHGHLKLACTHIGLDVGEDGRTHQCIDYIGVLANLFGINIIVPADPNQTDRALRHMLVEPGMFFLGMGRSKLPIITGEDGQPFFAGGYAFEMGRLDWIRRGARGSVVVTGTLAGRAVEAVERLRSDDLDVGIAVLATPAYIAAASLEELARTPG
ncbi:MAG: transketolase, partial [Planctomycetes bacterium]|nr:transketolase [Planctomycetota bacterium]